MANQIDIYATTGADEFRIEVDGTVEPHEDIADHAQEGAHYDPDAAWIEFSESSSHALGTETYWYYEGEITSWEILSGDTEQDLNGEPVTRGQVTAHYANYPMDRIVVVAGADSSASYDLSIDGDLEPGSGFEGNHNSSGASDEVSNSGWSDLYVDGSITEFVVDGNAVVYHNCDETDPADLVAAEPPSAAFTHSTDGLTVNLDASNSQGGTDPIEEFRWSFSGTDVERSGETTSHTFPEGGSYTVTLEVTDTEGRTNSTSSTVDVESGDDPNGGDGDDGTDTASLGALALIGLGAIMLDDGETLSIEGSDVSASDEFDDVQEMFEGVETEPTDPDE